MKSDYIIFTEVYAIHHEKGAFKLYLSQHTDGYFYAGLLYYTKTGDWSTTHQIHLDIHSQHFRATSKEDAKNAALNWLKENIKGNFSIELIETI